MADPVISPLVPQAAPLKLTVHPMPDKIPGAQFWSGEAPSFKDFLDVINPLQHIPIVSDIYQALTGDVPSAGSSIAGDTLFGGPIGMVASIFDNIIKGETGASFGGNVLAALEGKPVPALQKNTQTAENNIEGSVNASLRTNYNAYVKAGMLA